MLVVLGSHVDPTILSGMVEGLGDAVRRVVVTASTTSGKNGDLAALRTATLPEKIATVDGDETTIGRVATVLALVRQVTSSGGDFGAPGIDGVVPLG